MKKIFYNLLFISTITFAQREVKVGDFNKITSFDKIDVNLIPSKESKVILSGNGSEDVEVIIKNGELKLRMPFTKLLKGDEISAVVYFNKIDAIEANEGSRIATESTLEAINFEINCKEGSEINVKLAVDRLQLKAGSGSKIKLEGTAKNQDIVINAGTILESKKLISNQTIITANAGSEAEIYATDFVDAKVRAGGEINIYGKPKQINKKTVAGGKIVEYNK